MKLENWLETAFEYDKWATLQWLDTYQNTPSPNQLEPVLSHIVWAVENWLIRVDPQAEFSEGGLALRLEQASDRWSKVIRSTPLDKVISYQNTKGQSFDRQLGAIAFHVINHGSYHRGQLRAIAEEQGFLDFPETDLNVFLIQNDLWG